MGLGSRFALTCSKGKHIVLSSRYTEAAHAPEGVEAAGLVG
jgi:hypothetical protein